MPFGSFLRIFPRFPAPSIVPSLTSFRRKFVLKMLPIQSAFLFLVCKVIFFSVLTLFHFFFTRSAQLPSPAPHFETFKVFLIYFPQCPVFSTVQSDTPNAHTKFTSLFFKCKATLLVTVFILLNATFAVAVLGLISCVHLA